MQLVDLTIHAKIDTPSSRREEVQLNGLEQLYHWLVNLRGLGKAIIPSILYAMAKDDDWGQAMRLSFTVEWQGCANYELAREIAREVGLLGYSNVKKDLILALRFAQAYDETIRKGRKPRYSR